MEPETYSIIAASAAIILLVVKIFSKNGCFITSPCCGEYVCVLDTDEGQFGGHNRVDKGTEHFTSPTKIESWVGPYPQEPRECSMKVLSCARTAQVYRRVHESEFAEEGDAAAAVAR